MSIPEDEIMGTLDFLLNMGEPGSRMHHLIVTHAPAGPLGLPDTSKAANTGYGIAAVEGSGDTAEEFIIKSLLAAATKHVKNGETILFAAMNEQMWNVGPEDFDGHARELLAAGRLFDHPASVEVTIVYAVARDGRRWRARKFLTGPKAGTTSDVDLIVGTPQPNEAFGMPIATVLQRMAGLRN